jgi:hypothetical protein
MSPIEVERNIICIATYKELAWLIIMDSRFYDWVYWHFFTITINYYSSQSILTAEATLHPAPRSATASSTSLIQFSTPVLLMLTAPSPCTLSQFSAPTKSKSKLLYDWRFIANLFVFVSGPLRLTTRDIFQLNSCGNSPYVTSSLTRCVCLLWIGFAFVKCMYRVLFKILAFALHASLMSVQALQSRSCLSYVYYATTAA